MLFDLKNDSCSAGKKRTFSRFVLNSMYSGYLIGSIKVFNVT